MPPSHLRDGVMWNRLCGSQSASPSGGGQRFKADSVNTGGNEPVSSCLYERCLRLRDISAVVILLKQSCFHAVVSTVASQEEGSWFESPGGPGAFLCGVCMMIVWVLSLSVDLRLGDG